MNRRSVISTLFVLCLVTLISGLAVIVFSPDVIAASYSAETQDKMNKVNSQQFTSLLSTTNSIPNINDPVVALVMQPGNDEIHAFNALTGDWATLNGPGFRVDPDDVAITSNYLILVAQRGQDKLHAYSALVGEWQTLEGVLVRVDQADIFRVGGSVILVAQPGQEKIHAYSGLTGKWTTLSGSEMWVAQDDVVLVGPER